MSVRCSIGWRLLKSLAAHLGPAKHPAKPGSPLAASPSAHSGSDSLQPHEAMHCFVFEPGLGLVYSMSVCVRSKCVCSIASSPCIACPCFLRPSNLRRHRLLLSRIMRLDEASTMHCCVYIYIIYINDIISL